MTKRQIGYKGVRSLILSGRLGRTLQEDLPQIADDFRAGRFAPEIVLKYDLGARYGFGGHVTLKAVYFALKGFDLSRIEKVECYKGLLTEEEVVELFADHRSVIGRVNGLNVREKRLGIHSKSLSELRAYGQMGGNNGLSREERQKNSKLVVLSRGFVPWAFEEEDLAYEMSQKLPYGNKHAQIAKMLNDKYHEGKPVRKEISVRVKVYRMNKQKTKEKAKNEN